MGQHSVHRAVPANRALDLVDSLLERGTLTESETTDLRVEADVVRAVVELRADRPVRVDELVGPALSRPDTLPPFVVSVAANVATFGAVYRFDFDAARRLQDWALTYHRQNNGPWNAVTGQCWVGVAASEQLDLHAAEDNFRKALRMARRSGGGHSHTARLAGSLLGVLLYERGEIAEAERLLDEGYKLGAEGGPVDFELARYVVGARIKALRGDRAEAARRLTEGARIAENLSLRRLRAAAENERIGLGLPADLDLEAVPPVEYSARRRPATASRKSSRNSRRPPPSGLLLRDTPAGPNSPAPGRRNGWTSWRVGDAHGRCCWPGGCWSNAWQRRGVPTRPRRCLRRSQRNAHGSAWSASYPMADRTSPHCWQRCGRLNKPSDGRRSGRRSPPPS